MKQDSKPEPCNIPKQYSTPAEKTTLRASAQDKDSDKEDSSKDGYDMSNTDDFGNDTEDSVDALYQSYNVIKDAKHSFFSRNAFNMITVQAHLEYEDHFVGISQNQCNCYIICDNGADTWVIGDGWTILNEDPICTASLVTFDPAKMRKNGCLIVTAATTVKDADGNLIMIMVHDVVLNKGSPITLGSEFQTRESGVSINLVTTRCHHVDGEKETQSIYLHDDNDTIIPMKIRTALFCFQHWTSNDNKTFPIQYMTNIGPWEPQRFYDANDPLNPIISPVSTAYNTTSSPVAINTNMTNKGSNAKPMEMTKVTQPMGTKMPWSTIPSELPNEPKFMTSNTPTDEEEEPYFFDPSDNMSEKSRQGRAFHLSTNLDEFICTSEVD